MGTFRMRDHRRAASVLIQSLVLVVCSSMGALAAGGGTISGEVRTKPNKARANVVVYVEKVPGVHRPPAQPAQMDQKGLQFIPHVLPIVRGSSVKFLNNDNVSHNVFTPDGDKYDLGTWPQGGSKVVPFAKAGVYRQLCNVHPEMAAFIVVLENPFFALTGDDGKFKIENVPPGTYVVKAWSERLPTVSQNVTVMAGGTNEIKFEMKK